MKVFWISLAVGLLLAVGMGVAVSAEAQTLGFGWAGMGAGIRYWSPGPWGLQLGGLWSSDFASWGVSVLYRFNEAGQRMNLYLNANAGGTASGGESSLGAMLLGGVEWLFFGRLGLALETGIRYETSQGGRTPGASLGPGFGAALLFYLF